MRTGYTGYFYLDDWDNSHIVNGCKNRDSTEYSIFDEAKRRGVKIVDIRTKVLAGEYHSFISDFFTFMTVSPEKFCKLHQAKKDKQYDDDKFQVIYEPIVPFKPDDKIDWNKVPKNVTRIEVFPDNSAVLSLKSGKKISFFYSGDVCELCNVELDWDYPKIRVYVRPTN